MSTALGFDFGEKRIGIAVAELTLKIATPLTTITNHTDCDWAAIATIIQQWHPSHLIVGMPTHDGKNNKSICRKISAFCQELQTRFNIPVETIEEELSSYNAYDELKTQRKTQLRSKKIKKSDIDKTAAAIILESWLNQRVNNLNA